MNSRLRYIGNGTTILVTRSYQIMGDVLQKLDKQKNRVFLFLAPNFSITKKKQTASQNIHFGSSVRCVC